jgi:hypothetical protein
VISWPTAGFMSLSKASMNCSTWRRWVSPAAPLAKAPGLIAL